ncbi:thioredoxin domain-containing protein [Candidatus Woesearchaeota archaeon]|nr:thioredoxin domain-containing protein [Candidatus Woesearchaeota archaeon]
MVKKKRDTKKAVKEEKVVREKKEKSFSFNITGLTIISFILVGLLAILLVVSILTHGFSVSSKIGMNKAASNAISYLNSEILGPRGLTAELINVEEKDDYYVLTVDIGGQRGQLFLLKNGKQLFVSQPIEIKESSSQQQGLGVPKQEKTNIKFFVMSFCPFGNQAEYGLEPVYRLLGDKVEWEPHYVIYPASMYSGREDQFCMGDYCSMHGIQELHQDVREMCVWKYYDHSTWWDFVIAINKNCSASNADTCWQGIAQSLGIDINKINKCVEEEGIDLLAAEYQLNQEYGVRGSPTVFINDMQYNGARTPEAYKSAICEGFENPPQECTQELSNAGGSASGQC